MNAKVRKKMKFSRKIGKTFFSISTSKQKNAVVCHKKIVSLQKVMP
jgi:hypothetical protein